MDQPSSYVYSPASQRVDDLDRCRALLADAGAALWITGGDGVPSATLLPTLWVGDRLITHASAHNEQFHVEGPVACRVVVQGAHTYVSPHWYPSVNEQARGRAAGRAVGTWDYEQVQVAGWLRTHRDPTRLREELERHAEHFDAERVADQPSGPPLWRSADSPAGYLAAMRLGIIGIELEITDVVGRFKLSQSRTRPDREGVAAGLRERGRERDLAVARAVEDATALYEP